MIDVLYLCVYIMVQKCNLSCFLREGLWILCSPCGRVQAQSKLNWSEPQFSELHLEVPVCVSAYDKLPYRGLQAMDLIL